jgi:transposase
VVAKIGNGSEFQKGRDLSAYLGLVPGQNSSGDKQMLLGITKHGDRYIRQLLVHGGRACVQASLQKNKKTGDYASNDLHSVMTATHFFAFTIILLAQTGESIYDNATFSANS